MKSLIFVSILVVGVFGRKGFGPTDQEWGSVTVRKGAEIFYWLHYTTATTNYTDKPLLIWLQGGPGGSSTEYGNFEEIGPIDLNLKPRNYSWVNYANLMFVDNPVGTGFSRAENDQFATTNTQIAKDFVTFLQGFYKDLPQFENVPLYIFCESYGGKMTAEIALYLDQAIKNGDIKSNFKGIGLGDSWISPIDSCLTWAPYLYNLGLLDTQQYELLNKQALALKKLVDTGKWSEATSEWSFLESSVENYAAGVDFYNVLTKSSDYEAVLRKQNGLPKPEHKNELGDENSVMEQVRQALNISNRWGEQAGLVFEYLEADFMRPVTDVVERLLNETDIKVAVYNGQLDLIVDTPGTVDWVERLNFKGSDQWRKTQKTPFVVNIDVEGFQKKAGNLTFYWVLRSGHMVPKDNPNAMLYILEQVTDNFKV